MDTNHTRAPDDVELGNDWTQFEVPYAVRLNVWFMMARMKNRFRAEPSQPFLIAYFDSDFGWLTSGDDSHQFGSPAFERVCTVCELSTVPTVQRENVRYLRAHAFRPMPFEGFRRCCKCVQVAERLSCEKRSNSGLANDQQRALLFSQAEVPCKAVCLKSPLVSLAKSLVVKSHYARAIFPLLWYEAYVGSLVIRVCCEFYDRTPMVRVLWYKVYDKSPMLQVPWYDSYHTKSELIAMWPYKSTHALINYSHICESR